jgi:hypothetical protein
VQTEMRNALTALGHYPEKRRIHVNGYRGGLTEASIARYLDQIEALKKPNTHRKI